jgi:predicted nucleic acid-binding protein
MNGTLVERLEGKRRVSIDSAVVIYFVEEHARYLPIVDPLFERVADTGLIAISSYLTLLEVMVGPLRHGRPDIARQYCDLLLNSEGLELFPLEQSIAEQAAEIRAVFNFRTPDSIQLATALRQRAEAFVTNDNRLRRFDKLDVLVLDDFRPGVGR